jgi:dihydrofolate reductase
MSATSLDICLIAALSADGFIARDPSEPSTAWTSAGDKKRFVGLSKQAGALVMGRKTFETFGCRPLKDRVVFVCSRQPPTGAVCDPCVPGATGVEWTSLGPAQLAAELTARGFSRLAVCGGSEIYSQYMEAGLIRRLHLTIEPVLFGRGINLFNRILDTPLALVRSETDPEGSQFLDFEVKP